MIEARPDEGGTKPEHKLRWGRKPGIMLANLARHREIAGLTMEQWEAPKSGDRLDD